MESSHPSPEAGQALVLGTPLQGSRSCSRFLSISNPAPHPSSAATKRSARSRGVPLGVVIPSPDIIPGGIYLWFGPEFSLQRSRQVGEGDTRSVSKRDSPNPAGAGLLCLGAASSSVTAHGERWELEDEDHTLPSPLGTSQRGRAMPRGQRGAHGLHSQQYR